MLSTKSKFDGGDARPPWLYAGIILIGANLRAPITSVGPVLPDIQARLQLSDIGAGWLNALPLLIFALLSLVAPRVGRRYGLERILGTALIAILAGTLLRSLALPGAIWAGTLVLSIGIAFGNVLLPGLVKRDFPTNASGLIGCYAAAMAAMAGLAAGLAVPIASIPGSSWRWSLGLWALLALVALVVWRPQWRSRQHHLPNAVGSVARLSPWRHAIGWQVSLFFAFHSLVFYGIVDWFASYAASSGITLKEAGFYLLLYQVVAIATNLASAPLLRRLGDQTKLGFLCGLLLLIGSSGLLLMPHLSWLWLISAGLGAGVAMVTSLSLFALRTHDHHQAAALSGMAQFIGYLGAAAGPLLIGVLHDWTHAWTGPLLLMVAASLLVLVFATLAGRARFIE
jgi:CP family cyanate transporter-like MFS transporter